MLPPNITALAPCKRWSSSYCKSPNLWDTWLMPPQALLWAFWKNSDWLCGLKELFPSPLHGSSFLYYILKLQSCTFVIIFWGFFCPYRTFSLHLTLASHRLFWFSRSSISESLTWREEEVVGGGLLMFVVGSIMVFCLVEFG